MIHNTCVCEMSGPPEGYYQSLTLVLLQFTSFSLFQHSTHCTAIHLSQNEADAHFVHGDVHVECTVQCTVCVPLHVRIACIAGTI